MRGVINSENDKIVEEFKEHTIPKKKNNNNKKEERNGGTLGILVINWLLTIY